MGGRSSRVECGRDVEEKDWYPANLPTLPFELRKESLPGVACIDGSVIEPRLTSGSNGASIGGRVVRFEDGGGVSMYMGVLPEFTDDDFNGSSCPVTDVLAPSESRFKERADCEHDYIARGSACERGVCYLLVSKNDRERSCFVSLLAVDPDTRQIHALAVYLN